MDFSIYRMRVLDQRSGKDVAADLGISEPTVSRRLAKVRETLRKRLVEVIQTYSFTDEERAEPERNGLKLNPNSGGAGGGSGGSGGGGGVEASDDAMFDEAIAEIYLKQMELGVRTRPRRWTEPWSGAGLAKGDERRRLRR